jgi:hypothetical protein
MLFKLNDRMEAIEQLITLVANDERISIARQSFQDLKELFSA